MTALMRVVEPPRFVVLMPAEVHLAVPADY